ncbi:MAG TPA: TatD family hydrolase [Candidatus Paceibacterota bacterium]|nr:TatD family hydrolase [Candidatus Paceibacterota bacterium]
MPEYIDIHAHLNFPDYESDRKETIKRALDENVWIINVGTDIESSKTASELANQYESGVYAIVGQHPTDNEEDFHDSEFRTLLKNEKVVAVGECGLDYFRSAPESIERQKEIFIKQIELANEVGKPLMLHIRGEKAYKDAYEILKSHAKVAADLHFFAGDWEIAKSFLDLGFRLSFTGVITFARDYDEVIKKAPLDMIMSETDCPFVTPMPYRGKRNEPLYVKEVVKSLAEIRGEDPEMVKKQLIQNAYQLFKLG